MAPYKGTKIVTYHRSWPNFMERFGLDVMGYVEPKPGIPPSPSHTLELIDEMKRQNAKLIVVEPYFDLKTPQSIANQVGGKVLVLAPSVGGTKEATDYIQLFDYDVNLLVARAEADHRKVGRHGLDDLSVPGAGDRRQPDHRRHPRVSRSARRRARGHLRRPLARADRLAGRGHRGVAGIRPARPARSTG